ncbi:MAG: hypothetical protein ABI949_13540 [Ilumatobacteraceae bacterium]
MTEFHDPELRQELGRLSGPYPDDNIAFTAWQRRVGQVRRRRVVAWSAAAALSLIIGTVAVAALQTAGHSTLVPGKSADTSADVSSSVATTESEPEESSTTSSTLPEAIAATTPVVETTPITEVVETAAPETEAPVGEAPASGSNTKPHAPPTPTTRPPQVTPAATTTFSSIGGSITLRIDGDHLDVVATKPAPGFRVDQNTRPGHKIEVTFKSGQHESEIMVELENGVMKPIVTEKSGSPDKPADTVPADSFGHHGGGGGGNG